VPIRRELIEFGLLKLVDVARRGEEPFLWSSMTKHARDVTRVSGYFSSFWADLSRKEFKITEEDLSLYSFRHVFQDRLSKAGFGDETKKALMGHAESGMTGRYGTKKAPRPVNIVELNAAIQALDWPFLKDITGPETVL
jgi:integrase